MECETNDCRKEKRGCKGCYYNKTADEMFEELGYKKEEHHYFNCNYIAYLNKEKNAIDFMLEHKTVRIWAIACTIQELQAINKKVEELGWK